MTLIERAVARCHVNDSLTSVTRQVLTRNRGARRAFLGLSPEERREFIRAIRDAHRANQSLYRAVLRGSFL